MNCHIFAGFQKAMTRIEECYFNTEDDVIDNLIRQGTQNGNR